MREIVLKVTKGTLMSENMDCVENRYLMSLRLNDKHEIGIILLECSTDQMVIAHLEHDYYYEKLKTLILQYRPLEVLIDPNNIDSNIKTIITNSIWQPVVTILRDQWN